MLVFKDAGCWVSGSDVAFIIIALLASLSGQSVASSLFTSHKSIRSPLLEPRRRLKSTRYQVPNFGDRNGRKDRPSRGELSYCRWKRAISVCLSVCQSVCMCVCVSHLVSVVQAHAAEGHQLGL